MIRVFLMFFFVFQAFQLDGQNLVLNPSFNCTDSISILSQAVGATHGEKSAASFNGSIKGWREVSGLGLPSVHYLCSPFRRLVIPEYGDCCIGLTLYAPAADDHAYHKRDYIDYVRGELTMPLSVDSTYLVEIRIKNQVIWPNGSEFTVCCRNKMDSMKYDTSHIFRLVQSSSLGVLVFEDYSHLDEDLGPAAASNLYDKIPQFQYCDLLEVDENWTTIRGAFRANNNGRYFIFGNFQSAANTLSSVADHERKTFFINDAPRFHYIKEERISNYFLDYIELSPCSAEEYEFYRSVNCAETDTVLNCENELGLAPYLPSASNPNPQRVCYIGNYELAFKDAWNNSLSDFPSDSVSNSLNSGYSIRNAVAEIVDLGREFDIICLNEQHVNSEHRAYLNNVLEGLYLEGYRYLFVEALDSSLPLSEYNKPDNNPRTYWGPYVRDPVFSHLLKKAKALGFKVFPYEPTKQHWDSAYVVVNEFFPDARNDSTGWYMTPDGNRYSLSMGELHETARDYAMTVNMKKVYDAFGFRKSVVFGGGQHFLPGSCGYGYSVYHWLKDFYPRKRILSVNQITGSEDDVNKFKFPIVLFNEEKNEYFVSQRKCFSSGDVMDESEITVIHPFYSRTGQSRPTWLSLGGDRVLRKFRFPDGLKYPLVLTAYAEYSNLMCDVPADAVEYYEDLEYGELYVGDGCYDLYFITDEGIVHKYTCFE